MSGGSEMSHNPRHNRHSHQNYSGNRRGRGKGGFGGIPDRWLNYDAVGRDIEGSRFVPFKTPLHPRFFQDKPELHPDDYFDVPTLLSYAREAGKRLGLVIDLTNTDRYYDKSEWQQYDIKYLKITCPGHEVNTREDIVEKFIRQVDEYLTAFPDDSLIGVHCTHGLNRTGYLICRYLIDRMGWTAARAISQFEYCRGHPIERGNYKKSLYSAEQRIVQGYSSYTVGYSASVTENVTASTSVVDRIPSVEENKRENEADTIANGGVIAPIDAPLNKEIPRSDNKAPVSIDVPNAGDAASIQA